MSEKFELGRLLMRWPSQLGWLGLTYTLSSSPAPLQLCPAADPVMPCPVGK